MLTKAQFDRLRVGDVVLYNGTPRVVRGIHTSRRGCREFRYIQFAIMRRSWTGRLNTTRSYHDVKHALALPRKERNVREVCRAEECRLKASAFDVEAKLTAQIAEAEAWYKRREEQLGEAVTAEERREVAFAKQALRKLRRRKKGA